MKKALKRSWTAKMESRLSAQRHFKALVLSDVHGRIEIVEKIVKANAKGCDFAFLLGDLTNFGGKEEAEKALRPLQAMKILGFAGNLDTMAVQETLEEKGISLHSGKKKFGGFAFVGFGGGLEGDPGRFLFSEAEIKEKLQNLMQGKNEVLLTHLPPYGTKLDLAGNGMHVGSRAVKEIILQMQPVLHLCGHCHESAGEEKIGKTLCINVGAAKEGKALILEFGDEIKWRRVQA